MKDLQSHNSSRSCEKGEFHGVTTGTVEAWSKIAVRPGGKGKARNLARANRRGSDTQEVTRISVIPYPLASRFARQPARTRTYPRGAFTAAGTPRNSFRPRNPRRPVDNTEHPSILSLKEITGEMIAMSSATPGFQPRKNKPLTQFVQELPDWRRR